MGLDFNELGNDANSDELFIYIPPWPIVHIRCSVMIKIVIFAPRIREPMSLHSVNLTW